MPSPSALGEAATSPFTAQELLGEGVSSQDFAVDAGTFGPGAGVHLSVEAQRILEKFLPVIPSQLATVALGTAPGSGDAGDITVTAGQLRLTAGAQIDAATFGSPGKGGRLSVEAQDIVLEGAHQGFDSALLVGSVFGTPGSGAGGDLTVHAGSLRISDGATVSGRTFGPGAGGNLFISAATIELRDGGSISSQSNSESSDAGRSGEIFIRASDSLRLFNDSHLSVETAQADARDINVQVGSLLHLRDSSIITSVAGGTGDGGNITIDPTFVILDNSQIVARAVQGKGGNIRIVSDFFFQSLDSLVDASSGNPELTRSVVIDAPDTDLTGGLVALPANFLDTAAILPQACAERLGSEVSRLVVRHYEVLPELPYALRVGLPNAPDTFGERRATRTWDQPPSDAVFSVLGDAAPQPLSGRLGCFL